MESTIFEAHPNGHDNSTDNDVVSLSEAAELLGVHPNTVRYRIKQGHYKATKVLTVNGEAWVMPRSEIQKALDDTSQPPSTALSHPTVVANLEELITQVAHQVAQPLKEELASMTLELGQSTHTIERLAEDLGRERQLRITRETEIEGLKTKLAQAGEPKKRWWQR